MGRFKILQPENDEPEPDPEHPSEWTTQGCPGSWYRSAWSISVCHYERMLTESGFSENLHLSRSEDRLLLDAVAYLECERVRARNYDEQRRAEHMRRSNGTK